MKKLLLLGAVLILALVYLDKPEEAPITSTPTATSTPREDEVIPEVSISISPANVIQGEPVLIVVNNAELSDIKSLTFNGKAVKIFTHDSKPSAFVGIDLRMETGTYPLKLTLSDGQTIQKDLIVGERTIVKAPLGIPDKLGGNTPEAEKELINTLVQEGNLISTVPTSGEMLWSGDFRLPLNGSIVVTDNYGYSRLTGASTIAHKGTDFRASVGTPVYAMNSGTVRFTRELRNYDKTIIIDHGLGLHTIYMHLSEISVALNQNVKIGDLIAKSGETGYVLGPHLHVSIRIGGISIDPEKFMELVGE